MLPNKSRSRDAQLDRLLYRTVVLRGDPGSEARAPGGTTVGESAAPNADTATDWSGQRCKGDLRNPLTAGEGVASRSRRIDRRGAGLRPPQLRCPADLRDRSAVGERRRHRCPLTQSFLTTRRRLGASPMPPGIGYAAAARRARDPGRRRRQPRCPEESTHNG